MDWHTDWKRIRLPALPSLLAECHLGSFVADPRPLQHWLPVEGWSLPAVWLPVVAAYHCFSILGPAAWRCSGVAGWWSNAPAGHVDTASVEPLLHCQLQPESEPLPAEASMVLPGAMSAYCQKKDTWWQTGCVEWLPHSNDFKKQRFLNICEHT